MNASLSRTRLNAGSTLVITLSVAAVVSLLLISYLTLVSSSSRLTARSQIWNSAMAVAEAGAEEALAHLNENGVNKTGKLFGTLNLASQGWIDTGTSYFKRRALGENYFEVTIVTGAKPVITSTGYVPLTGGLAAGPGPMMANAAPWQSGNQFVSRSIRVVCRSNGRYTKAIIGKDKVELNGKDVYVDSYHSYDTNASAWSSNSLWGLYDPAKRRDAGDVAVIRGFKDVMKISKATVLGRVSTGPQGNIKLDKNALVGSLDWVTTHTSGVEPGWSADDANFDMPDVEVPFSTGFIPTGGWVGTNYYDYILPDGDYELEELKGSVLVTGNARLLVTKTIQFSEDPKDNHGIEFDSTARLEIYMAGKDAKLVGKKDKKSKPSVKMCLNQEGNPTNFLYFGLRKHDKLEVKNMDDFTGIIYAPYTEITLKAGSTKYYHCNFHGAIMGERIKLEKNVSFHYDENLAGAAADIYLVESWEEI